MGVRRVSKADAAGCGHAQAVRRVQRGALLRDRQGVPLTLQSLFALFLTPFLRFFICKIVCAYIPIGPLSPFPQFFYSTQLNP
jgi:hypothetical protein